mmetsp:Transcript_18065/g.31669  ORF Transcript_18065/g.31669 Transcript_18065/m.31669 type:complete len:134 (+) Transcript_18065:599-1000(+)
MQLSVRGGRGWALGEQERGRRNSSKRGRTARIANRCTLRRSKEGLGGSQGQEGRAVRASRAKRTATAWRGWGVTGLKHRRWFAERGTTYSGGEKGERALWSMTADNNAKTTASRRTTRQADHKPTNESSPLNK